MGGHQMMMKIAIGAGIAAFAGLSACNSTSEKSREDAEMAEINKIYEDGMADINAMTQDSRADLNPTAQAASNELNSTVQSETAAMDSLGAEAETN